MATTPERWEQGSEFHDLRPLAGLGSALRSPWDASPTCWTSAGRDAIRHLLVFGVQSRGWKRCWIPSYLCQEVVAAARSTGIPCVLYGGAPGDSGPAKGLDARRDDVVFVVHHFGLAGRPAWLDGLPAGVDTIEDHTHDPWSRWAHQSEASYALASLRKTLPIPEGSPIWSPAGLPLPPDLPLTEERSRAAEAKRCGMKEKARYLAGDSIEKTAFRAKLLEGETAIASGEISGISDESRRCIQGFPSAPWRDARLANAEYFRILMADLELLELVPWSEGSTPFSCILLAPDQAIRDHLRGHLVAQGIYPAILWPLDSPELSGVRDVDKNFSSRMLSLHCDGRYDVGDMERVFRTLEGACPS